MWPNHKRQRGGFSLFALKRRQGFPTVQNSNSQKAVRRHRKSRKRPAVQVKHYLTEKSWALFLFRCSLNTGLQALGETKQRCFSWVPTFLFFFHAQRLFAGQKFSCCLVHFSPFPFWIFFEFFGLLSFCKTDLKGSLRPRLLHLDKSTPLIEGSLVRGNLIWQESARD